MKWYITNAYPINKYIYMVALTETLTDITILGYSAIKQ